MIFKMTMQINKSSLHIIGSRLVNYGRGSIGMAFYLHFKYILD
jgi:hypothetical protein